MSDTKKFGEIFAEVIADLPGMPTEVFANLWRVEGGLIRDGIAYMAEEDLYGFLKKLTDMVQVASLESQLRSDDVTH